MISQKHQATAILYLGVKTVEQRLRAYLESLGGLPADAWQILTGYLEVDVYKRGEPLWKAGERSDKIYFIGSGLVRLFFFDENGQEVTVHFLTHDKFLADVDSLHSGTPSSVSAVAEEVTEVAVFKPSVLKKLEADIYEWPSLLRKVSEKSLFEKVKMRNELFQREAKERYLLFLNYFPNVTNQVKAAHVASFLSMSQYTLSHIKKELVQTDFLRNRKN